MGWKTFNVAGVTFKNNVWDTYTRLDNIEKYSNHGSKFELVREYKNKHDKNAVEVRQRFKGGGSIRLGYVPKKLAAEFAHKLDNGWEPVVKFGRKFVDEATCECKGLQLRYELEEIYDA